MKEKNTKVAQSCLTLWLHGLYNLWNSLGQNTGLDSRSLLQGIFPTQGSNPGLLYCRQILYQLSYQGSPRILEWIAYSFSSRSSQPRDQSQVSCIAGRHFNLWATREVKWLYLELNELIWPNRHLSGEMSFRVNNIHSDSSSDYSTVLVFHSARRESIAH